MNELSQYIKYRIERLKKTDGLITLSFFVVGVSVATWKYGIATTALMVFIFFSGLVFAEFLSSPKFYLSKNKKRSAFENGRIIFTVFLLTLIVIIQLFLWDRLVTIYSLGIGIVFGIVIWVNIKFR